MLKEVINVHKQIIYRHRDVLHCSFDTQVDQMADATNAEDLVVLLLQVGQDRVICPTHDVAVVTGEAYQVVPRNVVFTENIRRQKQ